MKLIVIFLIALALSSCGKKQELETKPSSADSGAKVALDYSYQITGGYNSNRWMGVELSRKLTMEELTTLATKLREVYTDFSIGFRLKGMKGGDLPWATALFEPDLKITINGSTQEEQNKAALVAAHNTDGKVIGKWHEDGYWLSTYVVFEKSGKSYERKILEPGIIDQVSSAPNILVLRYASLSDKNSSVVDTMEEQELIKKKVHGLTRFYEKDGHPEEYFIISIDSNMDFYDDDGYVNTAVKIQ